MVGLSQDLIISSPTWRISYHDHDHPTIVWEIDTPLSPPLTWAKALMYYRFLPTDLRLAGYTAAWQVVPGGSRWFRVVPGDHVLDELLGANSLSRCQLRLR